MSVLANNIQTYGHPFCITEIMNDEPESCSFFLWCNWLCYSLFFFFCCIVEVSYSNNSLFAGPLSSIWKEWVTWCIEFGVEANAVIAAPYDWRLSPAKLEERDLYFHKLKFVHLVQIFNFDCFFKKKE